MKLRGLAAVRLRAWAWARALRTVRRRGAALLFFAALDLVFAYGLASAPASTRASTAYAFLAALLPLWVWAVPWALVGVMCLVYAFRRWDRPAFIAASMLKVGWGAVYLGGWALGEIPRGYVAGAIWLVFAAFVQLIAAWPDARDP